MSLGHNKFVPEPDRTLSLGSALGKALIGWGVSYSGFSADAGQSSSFHRDQISMGVKLTT